MSTEVALVVLFAALLHATWNTLVKAAGDKLALTVQVCLAAGVISILAVTVLPAPAPQSWPYLAASVVIHIVYYALVGLSYHRTDLSVAYPLMRGLPPLGTTALAVLLMGETVSLIGLLGVLLVSGGLLMLLAESTRSGALDRRALMTVLAVSVLIVTYTINDALGARLSGHSGAYVAWMHVLLAPAMLALGLATRSRDLMLATARAHWKVAFAGGACTMLSYGLTLWAMRHAPVALVAALREVSVIFGLLIAAVVLRERLGRVRIIAVVTAVAGVVAIRMG